jgi:hypothetical protein
MSKNAEVSAKVFLEAQSILIRYHLPRAITVPHHVGVARIHGIIERPASPVCFRAHILYYQH